MRWSPSDQAVAVSWVLDDGTRHETWTTVSQAKKQIAFLESLRSKFGSLTAEQARELVAWRIAVARVEGW